MNDIFHYDDGLRWSISPKYGYQPGDYAGWFSPRDGLLYVTYKNKRYLVKNLVWELVNGPIPDKHRVVVIDGDEANIVIENLKVVSCSDLAFKKRLYTKSKTGHKGVYWSKQHKKYRVQLRYKGKKYHLGDYDSVEDAAKAYDAKAIEILGDFYDKKQSVTKPPKKYKTKYQKQLAEYSEMLKGLKLRK